jgi:hypothetical protein
VLVSHPAVFGQDLGLVIDAGEVVDAEMVGDVQRLGGNSPDRARQLAEAVSTEVAGPLVAPVQVGLAVFPLPVAGVIGRASDKCGSRISSMAL